MKKSSAIRLAGFVGALCASGALLGTSISSTGAWFTDHKDGSITANSGSLTIDHDTSDMALNYADLMPGDNVPKSFNYTVNASSGKVDVWLVFPKNRTFDAFTGGKNTSWADGGMGRYGFFDVSDSHGGDAFRSGNLAFPDSVDSYPSTGSTAGECSVDANGRGGSNWVATDSDTNAPNYCGIPDKILLASNLSGGTNGTVTVTLGLDGTLQVNQNQKEPTPTGDAVSFSLVATQAGHRP